MIAEKRFGSKKPKLPQGKPVGFFGRCDWRRVGCGFPFKTVLQSVGQCQQCLPVGRSRLRNVCQVEFRACGKLWRVQKGSGLGQVSLRAGLVFGFGKLNKCHDHHALTKLSGSTMLSIEEIFGPPSFTRTGTTSPSKKFLGRDWSGTRLNCSATC